MKGPLAIIFLTFLALTNLHAQNGLNFDGTDDHILAPVTNITGASSRTVEAWIQTSFVGAQRVIVDMGLMPVGQRFTLNILNGLLRIEIGGGGINSTVIVADGNWHHVAAVYDAAAVNKYALYIDGTLNASGNIAQAINTAAGTNLLIGSRNDLINRFLGNMDEVRVWNYARSQTQIQNDRNTSYCSPQAGLVAYYKFNQGNAGGNNSGLTTAFDYSGFQRNGILNGFTLNGATSNWVLGTNILPGTVTSSTSVTSCPPYLSPSGNYSWSNTGIYQDTIVSVFGCDSAMTINLSILPVSRNAIMAGACYTYTSPSGNHIWTSSGNYTDTLTSVNGCDSILDIALSIYTATTGIISPTVCDSMMIPSGGGWWTQSNIYYDTLANVNGCDSFLTVFLTVNQSVATTDVQAACNSYTWSATGQTYTSSGTFTSTLSTMGGCDSTVTLQLSVTSLDTSITFSFNNIMANASPATYQWLHCDFGYAVIGGANSQIYNGSQLGNVACEISNNGCADTTACYPYIEIAVDPSINNSFKCYPNPNDGRFSIEVMEIGGQLEVWNALGKRIYAASLEAFSTQHAPTAMPAGTYFVRYSNAQDGAWQTKRLLVLPR